jgi:biotin operon repressor
VHQVESCHPTRHLADGTPVVSEANIIKHIQALEDIGYRIVGTEEAEAGELYVYDQVEALANQCALSEVLECNVWYQKGDGMHQSVPSPYAELLEPRF